MEHARRDVERGKPALSLEKQAAYARGQSFVRSKAVEFALADVRGFLKGGLIGELDRKIETERATENPAQLWP